MRDSETPIEIYQITLYKHTGMILAWQNQTISCVGTKEQCLRECANVQTHNFLLGWWSFTSLIINPLIMLRNWYAASRIRRVA